MGIKQHLHLRLQPHQLGLLRKFARIRQKRIDAAPLHARQARAFQRRKRLPQSKPAAGGVKFQGNAVLLKIGRQQGQQLARFRVSQPQPLDGLHDHIGHTHVQMAGMQPSAGLRQSLRLKSRPRHESLV